jgi:hypothetical protein
MAVVAILSGCTATGAQGTGVSASSSTHTPAATSAPVQTSAPNSHPECTTAALEVWLGIGVGGGAMGSTYYPMEFTNVSAHACNLTGYPGVSAYGGGHSGSPASRVPSTSAPHGHTRAWSNRPHGPADRQRAELSAH